MMILINIKLILIIILLLCVLNIKLNIKVCICTLGKQENKYIREFISFYKKIGVDKIYLYDNNNINGERFEDVIQDYIDIGFVDVINWRGVERPQLPIMNDCYKLHYLDYDWLIFYDVDEYIHLSHYSNIKYFLKKKILEQCQLIYLNLIIHSDNNQLYYENKSLFERFPGFVPKSKPQGEVLEIKFILKGHIPNINIENQHYGTHTLKDCNGFGKSDTIYDLYTKEPDYKYYYIDHFFSKSTEELIDKILKGDCIYEDFIKLNKVERYFNATEPTKEKIDLIEQRLGFNLSKYKH